MVSITLRVLTRPDAAYLPQIYRELGTAYDDVVLPVKQTNPHNLQPPRRVLSLFLLFAAFQVAKPSQYFYLASSLRGEWLDGPVSLNLSL
jgi:hypothetical protein